MKQGRASHDGSGSTKTEPVSRAVDPGAVSRMGETQIYGTKSAPVFSGPGLQAPMASSTTHKSGSQG